MMKKKKSAGGRSGVEGGGEAMKVNCKCKCTNTTNRVTLKTPVEGKKRRSARRGIAVADVADDDEDAAGDDAVAVAAAMN